MFYVITIEGLDLAEKTLAFLKWAYIAGHKEGSNAPCNHCG